MDAPVRILLYLIVISLVHSCTLCPLRVPPRPRPINQYKLPTIPEFDTEKIPKFCNFSRSLPVAAACRSGFENIFCTSDDAISSVAQCDNSDSAECSRCAHTWERSKWVVKWFDSLGKPAAGISDGNYYWLGDYETCQDLRDSGVFPNKYCRVEFEVPDAFVELGCPQTDPLAIILGVCFPADCNTDQLNDVVASLSPYKFHVDCEFDVKWGIPAYVLSVVFILFCLVQVYGSYRREKTGFWAALSLKRNVDMALSVKRESRDELHALHGVEFITFVMLIAGNVYNYMLPYIENVAFSYDGVSSMSMHLVNNYSYQIDGMLVLSCMYTTYLLYGSIETKSDIKNTIIKALVRFWPGYLFCILFLWLLFVGFASGPMWIHSDVVARCSSGWWKNLLFISNFFTVKDTCLDLGYVISLGTQYFVVLLFLLYLASTHLKYAKTIAYVMVLVSVGVTLLKHFLHSSYSSPLPPAPLLTADPISPEKMELLLDSLVLCFLCRLSPLAIGFLYGICLAEDRNTENDRYTQYTRYGLVVVSIASAVYVMAGLFDYAATAQGSFLWLLIYAGTHRTLWAFSVLTFLYLCHNGMFVWINAILTWRVFSPLSKLTWIALVLSEPIILFFFTALNRPTYATHWSTVYAIVSTIVVSYLAALLVDVFVARPIRGLIQFQMTKDYLEPEEQEITSR